MVADPLSVLLINDFVTKGIKSRILKVLGRSTKIQFFRYRSFHRYICLLDCTTENENFIVICNSVDRLLPSFSYGSAVGI